jgi:type IV pilus assembly protein PilO
MALTMDSIYKLPTSRKAVILVVILCVIIGLYAYAFFMPWQTEMKGLKGELNNLKRELNESKAIAKDLQKFKDQVAKLDIELANALTQLPNEKEIPEILRNISTLGKESNLEFTLFKPKPEEPQQFYANVPIELVVLGSYHNTGLFFDRVSKLPRIINVVNFSMTSAKDLKGKGETEILVRTSCLVNTYRFIEKKGEEKKSGKGAGSK